VPVLVTQWTADYSAMEATGSASKRRWLECCHLSMPSPRPAVCPGPSCVQHACILQPDLTHSSCVHVCMIFCGPRFSHILMTVICM